MKRLKFILLFLIMPLLPFSAGAQGASEEEMDDLFLNQDSNTDSMSGEIADWDFFGYFESENFFGVDAGSLEPGDELIKLETRARLNLTYGTDFTYAQSVFDLYFYPEIGLTNAQEAGKVEPYEFFLATGKKLQFKIGKIVHNWGSADAFRIVNYLDQRDLRELFMKEEDERVRGSYSLSLKYLFRDFSFEGVVAAPFQPVLFPAEGTYWEIVPVSDSGVQPVLHPPRTHQGYENLSAAIRGGGTLHIFQRTLPHNKLEDNHMVWRV